jgi:hypothetical protein
VTLCQTSHLRGKDGRLHLKVASGLFAHCLCRLASSSSRISHGLRRGFSSPTRWRLEVHHRPTGAAHVDDPWPSHTSGLCFRCSHAGLETAEGCVRRVVATHLEASKGGDGGRACFKEARTVWGEWGDEGSIRSPSFVLCWAEGGKGEKGQGERSVFRVDVGRNGGAVKMFLGMSGRPSLVLVLQVRT